MTRSSSNYSQFPANVTPMERRIFQYLPNFHRTQTDRVCSKVSVEHVVCPLLGAIHPAAFSLCRLPPGQLATDMQCCTQQWASRRVQCNGTVH